jgi:hypothetical protein
VKTRLSLVSRDVEKPQTGKGASRIHFICLSSGPANDFKPVGLMILFHFFKPNANNVKEDERNWPI